MTTEAEDTWPALRERKPLGNRPLAEVTIKGPTDVVARFKAFAEAIDEPYWRALDAMLETFCNMDLGVPDSAESYLAYKEQKQADPAYRPAQATSKSA
ncbi:hypothetical protein [Microvirga calopogonii]|uniref:hypothetical protein n=1 Tax=Microvirga calopogonii TaxID=2078013 RepID=UPI000E0D5351|nr:hypothetical protein [Microvirga calopogonii]